MTSSSPFRVLARAAVTNRSAGSWPRPGSRRGKAYRNQHRPVAGPLPPYQPVEKRLTATICTKSVDEKWPIFSTFHVCWFQKFLKEDLLQQAAMAIPSLQ